MKNDDSKLRIILFDAKKESDKQEEKTEDDEDGLYRGTLRRGAHHAACGCALGENGEEVHIQPITGT